MSATQVRYKYIVSDNINPGSFGSPYFRRITMRKFCFFSFLSNVVGFSLLLGHIWPTQLGDINGLTLLSALGIILFIPLTYNAAFNPEGTWTD
jgi:hypothetical protein|tara:strand:- start:386 stop:664 length:279 start_codon:yes stop_codon:yes gene_type:complete